MKEVDTKGLKQLHERHPEFTENYTSFFLDVPDKVLRYRFFDRHPEASEHDFENRHQSAEFERKHANEYCDYIIDGTQAPEKILDTVLDIIRKHTI
jgi:guanylate kinase